jgi:26S proteasome regulatory subunit N7
MAPFYKYACEELKAPVDQALLTSLEAKNTEQLHKLEERFKDAEQNLGETEISDALIATAQYHTQIGNKV